MAATENYDLGDGVEVAVLNKVGDTSRMNIFALSIDNETISVVKPSSDGSGCILFVCAEEWNQICP
jgi:hypothetical protein